MTKRAFTLHRVKKQRQEEQGKEDVDMSDVLDDFAHKARDHARVPMQVRKPLNVQDSKLGTEFWSGILHSTRASRQEPHGCGSMMTIKSGTRRSRLKLKTVCMRFGNAR